MENIDGIYKAELNFVEEFNLNRHGMIKEIETEFNIIRLCIQEMGELDAEYHPMLDRILVMPLRKLLCENGSVLLNVCPDFKMPPLEGLTTVIEDRQVLIRPPYKIKEVSKWIPVRDWMEQSISWFDRDVNKMAEIIPQYTYESILNKMNGKKFKSLKLQFEGLYGKKQVKFKGEVLEVYCKLNSTDANANQKISDILDEIGYNRLSVYDFIKHMSDKRGAHIDVGHSLVVGLVNSKDVIGFTPIHYFAIQMIYAAKVQIPELAGYWVEMPELIIEGE